MRAFRHHPGAATAAALILFLATAGLGAAETGVLPYKTIAAILDGFASLKEKDRLMLTLRVVPAKKATPATPVQLEIRSRRGPIPVKLSEHGELLDFPVTPELRAENPPVASNQPKGTLSLQAIVRIRFSGNLTEKLSWYEEALRQANAAARSQAGLAGFSAPKAKTLAFAFPAGTNQSVTIKTAAGEKKLVADEKGIARLPIETGASPGDAVLVFSSKPDTIAAE